MSATTMQLGNSPELSLDRTLGSSCESSWLKPSMSSRRLNLAAPSGYEGTPGDLGRFPPRGADSLAGGAALHLQATSVSVISSLRWSRIFSLGRHISAALDSKSGILSWELQMVRADTWEEARTRVRFRHIRYRSCRAGMSCPERS